MIYAGDEYPYPIEDGTEDDDPQDYPCDACGADAGEPCRAGCIAG